MIQKHVVNSLKTKNVSKKNYIELQKKVNRGSDASWILSSLVSLSARQEVLLKLLANCDESGNLK